MITDAEERPDIPNVQNFFRKRVKYSSVLGRELLYCGYTGFITIHFIDFLHILRRYVQHKLFCDRNIV